ncbi:MAG TPA: hypothetical protein PK263_01840 [bacterium]|nr:hypothetical protein [bacterium]
MKDLSWKNWPYKNTTILIISIALFVYFLDSQFIQYLVKSIGSLGYLGSFFSGILFVSSFTVVPASALLFDIAKNLNPFAVALSAGVGAVIGDYIIFRFLKDHIFDELRPIFQKSGGPFIKKLYASPYFAWLFPILGAVIIASPMPDELGIGMMGLSKIKNWHFLLVTFLLNSIGILLVIVLSKSI